MRYRNFFALIPALLLCAAPGLSHAQVGVTVAVNFAPPVLPVYVQPPLPEPGYLWTPGYWAWDGMDYYWVPGTWVLPPASDLLWTPGYWGWRDGVYAWNPGYWGTQVGFYGGVNYGYGYSGVGFQGGYWHGGAFFYNRAAANFGHVNIVNAYDAPILRHQQSRVSFNGGQGGLRARPTAAERMALNGHHAGPTGLQLQHQQQAAALPALHASRNGGHPQILTTLRPGDFAHPGPGLHSHHAAGPGPQAQPRALQGEPPHEPPHEPQLEPQHLASPHTGQPREQPRQPSREQAAPRPQEHREGAHEQGRRDPGRRRDR